jgi:NAD+ diphosphatase
LGDEQALEEIVMKYPDTVNLPFNNAAVSKRFRMLRPGEPSPDGTPFWVVIQGSSMIMRATGEQLSLLEGDYPPWIEAKPRPLCFGTWDGRPVNAIHIAKFQKLQGGCVAEPFNATRQRLDDALLTLGGMAHQILCWEKQSLFCSLCSGSMESIAKTWGKRCKACKQEHFPHIHPCIIVLVKRGSEFLLTRKWGWPEGRYSLVAGFVDFGESLEECVRREVREETGIEIRNIRYVGSQNWPFPSQLMAGFVAEYDGGEIVVELDELEDARWFCTEDMPQSLPAKRSIARWIIDRHALGNAAF